MAALPAAAEYLFRVQLLKDLLRQLIAEAGDFNIAIGGDVKGSVTLAVDDITPRDLAVRLGGERQPLLLEQAVVLACPLLRRHDSTDPTAWISGLDWSALPAGLPRLVLAHGEIIERGGKDALRGAYRWLGL